MWIHNLQTMSPQKSYRALWNETWFTYISVTQFRVSPNIPCDILTSSRTVHTEKQQDNTWETVTLGLKLILLWGMLRSTTYLNCSELKWDPRCKQEMRSVTAKQTDIKKRHAREWIQTFLNGIIGGLEYYGAGSSISGLHNTSRHSLSHTQTDPVWDMS